MHTLSYAEEQLEASKSKKSATELMTETPEQIAWDKVLSSLDNYLDKNNYESEDKMVSHPSHYQSKKGIEVIDVIEAFTDGLEGIEAVCTANAIKYLCRWNKKNGIQDLEKSIWYIQKLINVLKSKNKEK